MDDLYCHVPIQVRLAGAPTDEQLAGIGELLAAALAGQLDRASRALAGMVEPGTPVQLHPPTFSFSEELADADRERLRAVVGDCLGRTLGASAFPAPSPGPPAALAAAAGRAAAVVPTGPRRADAPTPPRWRVRARFTTRVKVGDFIDLLGLLASSESFGAPPPAAERGIADTMRAQYPGLLDELNDVEVSLVEARLWILLDELTGAVLRRLNRPVRSGRFAWYGWTTSDQGRQRLLAIDRGGHAAALPALPDRPVLRWLDGKLFVRAGGMLLSVRMVLPEIRLEDLATLDEELIFSVRVRDLAAVVDPGQFQQATGLVWPAYEHAYGDEPAGLFVRPVVARRPVHAITLEHLVGQVVAGDNPGTPAFGGLRLLNRATLDQLPPPARDHPRLTILAAPDPPADRAAGQWERGWAGAFIYATPDLSTERIATARLRWKTTLIDTPKPAAAGPEGGPHRCQPYPGEPAVATLTDGAEDLINQILGLASELGVPACRFAGQFAIECATAIGRQAHAAGLQAVSSQVTTSCDVRSDGGGNNGWLHVRPGEAQELQALRRLAGVVPRVHELSQTVVSTYLRPANAGQVFRTGDREGRPNAAGWSKEFSAEFRSALILACKHLYLETCRVVFLQQLRYSRASIDQHRSQQGFPQTLEHFRAALGLLGESAVELSTLRLALAHAKRVFRTGTVREVLSVPERVHASVMDELGSELPAPIELVPQRLLELLATARIERRGTDYHAVHGGREWTAEELAQGQAARKGILNLVDPLFLHVTDLEWLYRQSQTDPARVEKALRTQLEDMSKANNEMLEETRHPQNGGYFAVEASQWVEAKGGRDAHGLKFELHGIHGLADEELRPHLGRLDHYVAAVNAVIGSTASFDKMVGFLSGVGIVVLGLLCAPLGATVAALVTGAASLAFTAYDVLEAGEKKRTFRGLVDPERIIAWQEVELAELMASIGVAFSFLDVLQVGRPAKEIATGAVKTLRLAQRSGAAQAAKWLDRQARRAVVRNMSRELLEKAAGAAVSEVAVMEAMELLLPTVLEPVLMAWMREQAVQHGTLEAVDQALGSPADINTGTQEPGGP